MNGRQISDAYALEVAAKVVRAQTSNTIGEIQREMMTVVADRLDVLWLRASAAERRAELSAEESTQGGESQHSELDHDEPPLGLGHDTSVTR